MVAELERAGENGVPKPGERKEEPTPCPSGEAEEQLKASTEVIVIGCEEDDSSKVLEAVEELTDYEKGVIWLRLNEGQKSTVREVISAAKEAA